MLRPLRKKRKYKEKIREDPIRLWHTFQELSLECKANSIYMCHTTFSKFNNVLNALRIHFILLNAKELVCFYV